MIFHQLFAGECKHFFMNRAGDKVNSSYLINFLLSSNEFAPKLRIRRELANTRPMKETEAFLRPPKACQLLPPCLAFIHVFLLYLSWRKLFTFYSLCIKRQTALRRDNACKICNNVKLLHICNFVRFLQNLYVCQILAKFASMSDSSAFFHLRVVPTLTESLSIEVYTLFACNTTKWAWHGKW